MDEIDRKIIADLGQGLVLASDPFSALACELGITSEEVVARINSLKQKGVIRRFGATIKPNNVGFSANALIAWKVPQSQVKEVGDYMSKLQEVSHCYERKPISGRWEYNIYTVIHGRERREVERLASQISELTGVGTFEVLFSTRDLRRAKLSQQKKRQTTPTKRGSVKNQ